jgi:hypothetical protein
VLCLAPTLATVPPAWAGEPDAPSLRAEVDALRARIGALEVRQRQDWLTHARSEEMRALVQDVLADADTRVTGLGPAVTAGWDDGFFIESADGDFKLELAGQIQVRLVSNHQSARSSDAHVTGVEMRRTKLKFDGHIFGRDVRYSIQGDFDRETGSFDVNDAGIELRLARGTSFKIGRARSPLLREEDISSKRQLTVERSLVSRAMTQGRNVGVAFKHRTDGARTVVALTDNTEGLFQDQGWRAGARLDLLLHGTWEALEDFTSFPGDEPAASLGGSLAYEELDFDDPAREDRTVLRWSVDAGVELGGLNLFAALLGQSSDGRDTPRRDQYGAVIQGGFFLSRRVELFAQYQWGDADDADPDLSVAVAGANVYFHGHDLKWTTDIGYGFNRVSGFWSSSGAGWRTDRPGEEGQLVVRSQVQLAF